MRVTAGLDPFECGFGIECPEQTELTPIHVFSCVDLFDDV